MQVVGKILLTILGLSLVAGILAFIFDQIESSRHAVSKNSNQGLYAFYVKRPLDATVATFALLFLSPLLIVLALMVLLKLGSPILFIQERPGKNEKIFKLYKFRTMSNDKDKTGALLPDEQRLTKFGQTLRASSLDELPELLNIIKGDMSLVGPRPLLVCYLPRYNERQKRRHLIRPGLTGLAQINGRNSASWEEKFAWDIHYVDNITFVGDIKVLFWTILKVLSKEGINSQGSATADEFMGNVNSDNRSGAEL